jgi:hypothetical protein
MVLQRYPLERILNTDETSWKLINNRMVTVGDRSAERVACEFDGNVKACWTVMASIDAAGSKLPLWIICRGKTLRCEASLRHRFTPEVRRGRLVLTHHESGWTDRRVALEYLHWLSERVSGKVSVYCGILSRLIVTRKSELKRRQWILLSNSYPAG